MARQHRPMLPACAGRALGSSNWPVPLKTTPASHAVPPPCFLPACLGSNGVPGLLCVESGGRAAVHDTWQGHGSTAQVRAAAATALASQDTWWCKGHLRRPCPCGTICNHPPTCCCCCCRRPVLVCLDARSACERSDCNQGQQPATCSSPQEAGAAGATTGCPGVVCDSGPCAPSVAVGAAVEEPEKDFGRRENETRKE